MISYKMRRWLLAPFAVLALAGSAALTGCSGVTGPPKPYAPTGHHTIDTIPRPTEFPKSDQPRAYEMKASEALERCSDGPLRGCSKGEMEEYAQGGIQLTWNDFYAKQTSSKPPRFTLYVMPKPQGFTTTWCKTLGGETVNFNEKTYAYCPADETVYLGEDTMWRLYKYGPLVPIVAIAHEFGHRLQGEANVTSVIPVPKGWSKKTEAEKEQYLTPWFLLIEAQADCAGGVWLRYAEKNLKIGANKAVIGQIIKFFADNDKAKNRKEDPSHGSAEFRRKQYLRGYNSNSGLKGCNDYHDDDGHSFASRPIVP